MIFHSLSDTRSICIIHVWSQCPIVKHVYLQSLQPRDASQGLGLLLKLLPYGEVQDQMIILQSQGN